MIDKDGKVHRGLQAQVDYLTKKVDNGGGSTPTGPTVDKITTLDLAVGEAALTYDANDGATIVKQGQIKAGGYTFNVAVEDELPIVPGDNVTIDATEDGKHLKISAVGGGGTGITGVSSFGGKTGAINVGKNLSMSGNIVNAEFQPTPVIIETLNDADASSGTLTDNQLATLQANTANPLVKRNEYYYLNDNLHTPGALGYTHLGYENGKWYTKNITITISTKGWIRKSSEIPDKTIIPFINLNPDTSTYPISGNFTAEDATKLKSQPFSTITFTPNGTPVQIPLLPQPSEQIHNSYIYSGHDDSYTYTVNATLSVTTGNTWLAKSYIITRNAYVAPVITTIDGVSGDIVLGANLHLENKVLTGTNTVTTVNGHTGTVNIVGGDNVTVNDVGGTLTISATSGGTLTFPAVDLTSVTVPSSGNLTAEQADLVYNNKVSFVVVADTDSSGLPQNIVLPLINKETLHNNYIYQVEFNNYTYKASLVVQKTTGGVWGAISYELSKNTKSDSVSTYMHIIQIGDNSQNNVYFNLTTTDATEYDYASLTVKMLSKRIYGQGRALVSNKGYPVAYIIFASQPAGDLKVYYYDNTGTTTQAIIPHTYFNDTVIKL